MKHVPTHHWLSLSRISSVVAGTVASVWPVSTWANINILSVIDGIAGGLSSGPGATVCAGGQGGGFMAIATQVFHALTPLFNIVAVLMIIIFGMRMIIGQEDDIVDKSRPTMTAIVGALVLVNLIIPMVVNVYGCNGENVSTSGGAALSDEVLGVINWILVIATPLAVLMIIITAFRAMLSANDDSIGLIKRSLGAALVGIVLLSMRLLIATQTASNDPVGGLVLAAIRVLNFIMQFMALGAVIMVVYAGFRLVLSFGNSDALTQARDLVVRVVIGAVLILLAYIIVFFLANPLVP